MRIDKVYLDIIAENGAGAIGYATRARFGGASLSPTAWLSWNDDTATGAGVAGLERGAAGLRRAAGTARLVFHGG